MIGPLMSAPDVSVDSRWEVWAAEALAGAAMRPTAMTRAASAAPEAVRVLMSLRFFIVTVLFWLWPLSSAAERTWAIRRTRRIGLVGVENCHRRSEVPVNLVSMVVTGAHESGTVLLLDDEVVGESVPGETMISRLIDDCCG